jgi:hypothetical protein
MKPYPPISWPRVARAIEYYESLGYAYLEVPWLVSEKALMATLPAGKKGTRSTDGPLVGSAEQSFIQMMLDGQMQLGKFMAATPCFRDDDEDEWHHRYFFKVELIDFAPNPMPSDMEKMISQALGFFELEGAADVAPVTTAQGVDIELRGIELGSYGIRSYEGFEWVYGTGLAEPRFSQALSKVWEKLSSRNPG